MDLTLTISILAGLLIYVEGCTSNGSGPKRTIPGWNGEIVTDEQVIYQLELFVESCEAVHDIVEDIRRRLSDVVVWYRNIYTTPACGSTTCWIAGTAGLPVGLTKRTELVSCILQWQYLPEYRDLKVAQWGQWSECSVTCGEGTRTRICLPMFNGGPVHTVKCGLRQSSMPCSKGICPLKPLFSAIGYWGPWKETGVCSKTCGTGSQKWRRLCMVDGQEVSSSQCEGVTGFDAFETTCNTHECPSSGSFWSPWRDESDCGPECGLSRVKRQRRSCLTPIGLSIGNCPGESVRAIGCPAIPCPQQQYWSGWTLADNACQYNGATRACTRKRTRYCYLMNNIGSFSLVTPQTSCDAPLEKQEDCTPSQCLNSG